MLSMSFPAGSMVIMIWMVVKIMVISVGFPPCAMVVVMSVMKWDIKNIVVSIVRVVMWKVVSTMGTMVRITV